MHVWEYSCPVPPERWDELLQVLVERARQVGRPLRLPGPERAQVAARLADLLRPRPTLLGWATVDGPYRRIRKGPRAGEEGQVRVTVLWYRRGKMVRVVALWEVRSAEDTPLVQTTTTDICRWVWQAVWPERAARLAGLLRARAQTHLRRVGLTLPEPGPRYAPVAVRILPRARAALVRLRSWDPWERPPHLVLVAGGEPSGGGFSVGLILEPRTWPPGEIPLATALDIPVKTAARLLRDEIPHAELLGELVAARLGGLHG
jgi:hypothetical protein